MAYVESPSQGGSARGGLSNLTLVGRDAPLNQTEGMVMQKVGGTWYVLCVSGGGENGYGQEGKEKYRVYDLNMRFVGYLNADFTSNIPHPMVTPLPVSGNTKWIMLRYPRQVLRAGWSELGQLPRVPAPIAAKLAGTRKPQ